MATLILILTYIAIRFSGPAGVKITRGEYGEAWPFTIEKGYLDCKRGSAVVFRADGITYALNGPALQRYESINTIVRDDPRVAEDRRLEGLKVSVGPIIKRGLGLCE